MGIGGRFVWLVAAAALLVALAGGCAAYRGSGAAPSPPPATTPPAAVGHVAYYPSGVPVEPVWATLDGVPVDPNHP